MVSNNILMTERLRKIANKVDKTLEQIRREIDLHIDQLASPLEMPDQVKAYETLIIDSPEDLLTHSDVIEKAARSLGIPLDDGANKLD
jgi:hypothetical protein